MNVTVHALTNYYSLAISYSCVAAVGAPYFFFVLYGCEQCIDENALRKRQKTPPEPGAPSSLNHLDRTGSTRRSSAYLIIFLKWLNTILGPDKTKHLRWDEGQ